MVSASARSDASAHHAALGIVVGEGAVAGVGLIPDGEVAGLPPPANLDVRIVEHRVQSGEQAAVGTVGPDDAACVERTQEEALASSGRMCLHERVLDPGVLSAESVSCLGAVVPFDGRQQ